MKRPDSLRENSFRSAAHSFGRVERKILPALWLALLLLSTVRHARAQETVVELDPAQTQIGFTLGDALHTVRGIFKLRQGTISFNPATGQAGGLVVVDATSGDSGNHARDRKMHKDVLQSEQYPEITFVPQRVQGQVLPEGDFRVQVDGIFTMHGESRPLTLLVQANATGEELTANVTFSVPYVNWGLKNPSTLFLRVSSTVDIAIQAVGHIRLVAAH
jgi:polyisoprenoid-binding protein YceI